MEVVGDINEFKDSIRKDFEDRIRHVDADSKEEIIRIENENEERLDGLRQQLKAEIARKAEEMKAITLNEQKLEAKSTFEETREKMVQELLSDIEKELPKKMKQKDFLDFLSKHSPKTYKSALGHSHFKGKFRNLKVDNSVFGVRFRTENMLIDLSLNGLLEAKAESNREKIIRGVWS